MWCEMVGWLLSERPLQVAATDLTFGRDDGKQPQAHRITQGGEDRGGQLRLTLGQRLVSEHAATQFVSGHAGALADSHLHSH